MKIYVILATILSVLFGVMPLYMAKISGIDGDACDAEIWHQGGGCVIHTGQGLFTFSLYFAIAVAFFIALFLFWKLLMWLLTGC